MTVLLASTKARDRVIEILTAEDLIVYEETAVGYMPVQNRRGKSGHLDYIRMIDGRRQ